VGLAMKNYLYQEIGGWPGRKNNVLTLCYEHAAQGVAEGRLELISELASSETCSECDMGEIEGRHEAAYLSGNNQTYGDKKC
jgi:hypothetical protein